MKKKRVLTTGEVAKFCGVNFRTVIRWIEKGHLKAYKLPGRGDNRIEIPHFLEFLRANKIPIPKEFEQEAQKVLIVEDNEHVAKSIQRILRKGGYNTIIANDGLKAGVMLATYRPSIMTLDLMLPGMDGLEVLTYLKQTANIQPPKILVISAMPEEALQKALEHGADDALSKPFDNKVLLDKIEALTGVTST